MAEKLNKGPRLTEWDKIRDNTNPDGDILCIQCEIGYLVNEIRDVKVSEGYAPPQILPLESFFCDICDYIFLEKEEVAQIRELLSK